jgi:16S rRNA (adenine1518-N6/adenine1519-N6)-dimethyltransferase
MTIVKFDQHFMIDKKIIKKIIKEANITEKDIVLEIGPGKGAITKELCKASSKIVCIEIDKENEKYLNFENENCKVIYGNALDLIWNVSFNKIVSNLPYVIIEPLFKKLTKINFDLCVFTITKNYYEGLCDESKKLHYFVNSYFDIKYICDVE